ncbi:hypothetical protein ASF30_00145 [Leifsonia sp. Leaf264]|nr:hypothetical protein ASF30_00145 [Leifsonia sp. Leaf264]
MVHRATVYRTMDVLADLGVVSHLHLPGEASVYHLVASPTGHEHLHAHCRVCAAVTVISGDTLDVASVRITEETGFRLEALQSTLMGICADCTQRSASS